MSDKFIIANKNNNNNNNAIAYKKPPYTKKGASPMNIIKVALYMLKGKKGGDKRTNNTVAALPEATNATLSRLVGSVRPLHLQQGIGGYSPPPPPLPPSTTSVLLLPPPSPEWGELARVVVSPQLRSLSSYSSFSSSSSSVGGMSRYASAQSLYDLDNHDEEEDVKDEGNDGDDYYDGLEGDDMIDSKAEMFIAKFYQQMRLQNSD